MKVPRKTTQGTLSEKRKIPWQILVPLTRVGSTENMASVGPVVSMEMSENVDDRRTRVPGYTKSSPIDSSALNKRVHIIWSKTTRSNVAFGRIQRLVEKYKLKWDIWSNLFF